MALDIHCHHSDSDLTLCGNARPALPLDSFQFYLDEFREDPEAFMSSKGHPTRPCSQCRYMVEAPLSGRPAVVT